MSASSPMRVAIAGVTGRTGKRVLAACGAARDVVCTAALASPSSPGLTHDAGEWAGLARLDLPITCTPDTEFDVLIDFSVPEALGAWIAACTEREAALVVGTTGHSAEQERSLQVASGTLAIVKAPNMGIGMNILLRAVSDLARTLGSRFDVEVVDIHHRMKRDAPSGTARALAECIRAQRAGESPTPPISSLRMGGVAGEHAVHFSSPDETITLSHRAHGGDLFAQGALRATRWVRSRGPGLYDMQDVLSEH